VCVFVCLTISIAYVISCGRVDYITRVLGYVWDIKHVNSLSKAGIITSLMILS